jgi:hypothetical protein
LAGAGAIHETHFQRIVVLPGGIVKMEREAQNASMADSGGRAADASPLPND